MGSCHKAQHIESCWLFLFACVYLIADTFSQHLSLCDEINELDEEPPIYDPSIRPLGRYNSGNDSASLLEVLEDVLCLAQTQIRCHNVASERTCPLTVAIPIVLTSGHEETHRLTCKLGCDAIPQMRAFCKGIDKNEQWQTKR